MITNEIYHALSGTGPFNQVSSPIRVLGRDHKWAAQPTRGSLPPVSGQAWKELAAQYDHNPFPERQGIQDLSHIVEQGCTQKIGLFISILSESLKNRKGMRLFGGLHAQEKDQLCGVEMVMEPVHRYSVRCGAQGAAELINAVADAGSVGQGGVSG